MDLEATCDDRGAVPKQEMEIIEIGAVLVEPREFAVLSEYQSFVRPQRHPRLTVFCRGLTTISQAEVDAAPLFPQVMELDCALHRVPYPMPGRHLNVKALFSETRGIKKRLGMAEALQHAGLELTGTHHRGIDDARNIARLLPLAVGRR